MRPGSGLPGAIKAVTIDLDGTLLDTIPDLAAAANMTREELGLPLLDLELLRTFVGKGLTNFVTRTLSGDRDGNVEGAELERGLAVFQRHYDEVNGRHTVVYPGVMEGLARLAAAKLPLACVTNKSTRYTLPLLDMFAMAPYFAQVVAGDTLSRKKPDPEPLQHVCRNFAIEPATMLMIGDSINDTQAARAAGCPVICVTYGYNEGHDVHTIDCDAVVDSLDEAARLVLDA